MLANSFLSLVMLLVASVNWPSWSNSLDSLSARNSFNWRQRPSSSTTFACSFDRSATYASSLRMCYLRSVCADDSELSWLPVFSICACNPTSLSSLSYNYLERRPFVPFSSSTNSMNFPFSILSRFTSSLIFARSSRYFLSSCLAETSLRWTSLS
mgnify:CR=1 FL=1